MRKILASFVAVAAATVGLAAPATAVAASATTFAPTHAAAAHGAKGFNINGYNWGGYAATGSRNEFTSVSATWVQPSATCNSRNDLYAPWVGLDGYGSSTVEQTGVQTDCSSGSPVDSFWYEMYPANPVYPSGYTVTAGNTIHASVTYTGSKFTLTLQNVTRGWTYTTSKSLSSARRLSAEVIIESPTGAYPNFGTINFTASTVNGGTLGSYNPVAMDPSNSHGYEAHTSALSGGTAFSIAYERE